jgi:hypothetical protein
MFLLMTWPLSALSSLVDSIMDERKEKKEGGKRENFSIIHPTLF